MTQSGRHLYERVERLETLLELTRSGVPPPGTSVFIFDAGLPSFNITNLKVDAASIDNTKTGIMNAGSNTAALPSLGVIGNYATCVGGDMPSINHDYAGGGGYRPNARGMGAWAFGYSAFADGEGCFAAGRSTVAGREDTGLGTERKYAVCFGFTCNGGAVGAFAFGNNSQVDIAADYGFAGGLNCLVGPQAPANDARYAFAFGNQSEAHGKGATAIGILCLANGEGAVCLGEQNTASGDVSCAIGNQNSSTHAGSIALGLQNLSDGAGSIAMGSQCQALNDRVAVIGYLCTATGVAGLATGLGARQTRYSERVHGFFDFSVNGSAGQAHDNGLIGTSANGAAAQLHTPQGIGNELTLTNGKTYTMRITFNLSRTDAQGAGKEVHELLVHTTGGVAVIDNDDVIAAITHMPVGWAVAIATPGGLILRLTGNGAVGTTVDIGALVEWTEMNGFA